jgi:hypothetical protein
VCGHSLYTQYIYITLNSRDKNKTTAIEVKFAEPLLYKGYTICKENFYDSPALAKFLKAI